MKNLILILAIVFSSSSLLALSLDNARSKGLVKELPTGFLEATDSSAKAFVEDVNKKRKAHYEKIATENKLPVEVVGKQAAEKIQEKLENE